MNRSSDSRFVISLDFELYWGVADSRRISEYRRNLEGVWEAVPRMLRLFKQYGVRVTWATVGMLMCRDIDQWDEIRPSELPGYRRRSCSQYLLGQLARDNPKLFFARPLVERIISTDGQELASHSYSHFYCKEEGASSSQFFADLLCAQTIASEFGLRFRSFVFPRNQAHVDRSYLDALRQAGISVYRSNPNHWLYRDGHRARHGPVGRTMRFIDSWLPLSGANAGSATCSDGLVRVPASLFVRPASTLLVAAERLRVERLKEGMSSAARAGKICHLWWHPHNFGVNMEQNLNVLEELLKHFVALRDNFGMTSANMSDFVPREIA
jgi:hypothetical protein